jgi:hypothetical protein
VEGSGASFVDVISGATIRRSGSGIRLDESLAGLPLALLAARRDATSFSSAA